MMTDSHASCLAVLAAAALVGACGGASRSAHSPQTRDDSSGSTPTSSATVTAAPATGASADRDAPGPGALADGSVRRGVAGQIATARARCGDIDRKIDRYETTLHLEIDARGTVEVARARGNHPLLDACIGDVARTWQFDASSGRTVAEVPIVITRTREE